MKRRISLEKTSKLVFVQNPSLFFSFTVTPNCKILFEEACISSAFGPPKTELTWTLVNSDSSNFGDFWIQFDFFEKARKFEFNVKEKQQIGAPVLAGGAQLSLETFFFIFSYVQRFSWVTAAKNWGSGSLTWMSNCFNFWPRVSAFACWALGNCASSFFFPRG